MNACRSRNHPSPPQEQSCCPEHCLPPEASLSVSKALLLVQQMEEIALTKLQPGDENAAYVTAVSECPKLIDKESNRMKFLQYCKQDPYAAAKRLVGYWKLRYDIFGPKRFYKPVVDFSGNGALCIEAVKLLEKGPGYLIPPSKEGSMVICFEYSNTTRSNKKLGDPTAIIKQQVVFFLAQLCSLPENNASVMNGVIIVHIVKEQRHTPSPANLQLLHRIGQDGFPFALRAYHYILAPRDLPNKKRDPFSHRAIPYMSEMMKRPLSFVKREFDFPILERSDSPAMQRAKVGLALVDRVGLLPGSLPPPAGGPWSCKRMMEELKSPQFLRVYSEIQPDPIFKSTVVPKDLSAATAEKHRKDGNNMKEIMNSPQGVSIYSDFKPSPGSKTANDLSALHKQDDDHDVDRAPAVQGVVQQQKNPLSVLADAAALLARDDFEGQCSVLTYDSPESDGP